jgi:hypothetical protein
MPKLLVIVCCVGILFILLKNITLWDIVCCIVSIYIVMYLNKKLNKTQGEK